MLKKFHISNILVDTNTQTITVDISVPRKESLVLDPHLSLTLYDETLLPFHNKIVPDSDRSKMVTTTYTYKGKPLKQMLSGFNQLLRKLQTEVALADGHKAKGEITSAAQTRWKNSGAEQWLVIDFDAYLDKKHQMSRLNLKEILQHNPINRRIKLVSTLSPDAVTTILKKTLTAVDITKITIISTAAAIPPKVDEVRSDKSEKEEVIQQPADAAAPRTESQGTGANFASCIEVLYLTNNPLWIVQCQNSKWVNQDQDTATTPVIFNAPPYVKGYKSKEQLESHQQLQKELFKLKLEEGERRDKVKADADSTVLYELYPESLAAQNYFNVALQEFQKDPFALPHSWLAKALLGIVLKLKEKTTNDITNPLNAIDEATQQSLLRILSQFDPVIKNMALRSNNSEDTFSPMLRGKFIAAVKIAVAQVVRQMNEVIATSTQSEATKGLIRNILLQWEATLQSYYHNIADNKHQQIDSFIGIAYDNLHQAFLDRFISLLATESTGAADNLTDLIAMLRTAQLHDLPALQVTIAEYLNRYFACAEHAASQTEKETAHKRYFILRLLSDSISVWQHVIRKQSETLEKDAPADVRSELVNERQVHDIDTFTALLKLSQITALQDDHYKALHDILNSSLLASPSFYIDRVTPNARWLFAYGTYLNSQGLFNKYSDPKTTASILSILFHKIRALQLLDQLNFSNDAHLKYVAAEIVNAASTKDIKAILNKTTELLLGTGSSDGVREEQLVVLPFKIIGANASDSDTPSSNQIKFFDEPTVSNSLTAVRKTSHVKVFVLAQHEWVNTKAVYQRLFGTLPNDDTKKQAEIQVLSDYSANQYNNHFHADLIIRMLLDTLSNNPHYATVVFMHHDLIILETVKQFCLTYEIPCHAIYAPMATTGDPDLQERIDNTVFGGLKEIVRRISSKTSLFFAPEDDLNKETQLSTQLTKATTRFDQFLKATPEFFADKHETPVAFRPWLKAPHHYSTLIAIVKEALSNFWRAPIHARHDLEFSKRQLLLVERLDYATLFAAWEKFDNPEIFQYLFTNCIQTEYAATDSTDAIARESATMAKYYGKYVKDLFDHMHKALKSSAETQAKYRTTLEACFDTTTNPAWASLFSQEDNYTQLCISDVENDSAYKEAITAAQRKALYRSPDYQFVGEESTALVRTIELSIQYRTTQEEAAQKYSIGAFLKTHQAKLLQGEITVPQFLGELEAKKTELFHQFHINSRHKGHIYLSVLHALGVAIEALRARFVKLDLIPAEVQYVVRGAETIINHDVVAGIEALKGLTHLLTEDMDRTTKKGVSLITEEAFFKDLQTVFKSPLFNDPIYYETLQAQNYPLRPDNVVALITHFITHSPVMESVRVKAAQVKNETGYEVNPFANDALKHYKRFNDKTNGIKEIYTKIKELLAAIESNNTILIEHKQLFKNQFMLLQQHFIRQMAIQIDSEAIFAYKNKALAEINAYNNLVGVITRLCAMLSNEVVVEPLLRHITNPLATQNLSDCFKETMAQLAKATTSTQVDKVWDEFIKTLNTLSSLDETPSSGLNTYLTRQGQSTRFMTVGASIATLFTSLREAATQQAAVQPQAVQAQAQQQPGAVETMLNAQAMMFH